MTTLLETAKTDLRRLSVFIFQLLILFFATLPINVTNLSATNFYPDAKQSFAVSLIDPDPRCSFQNKTFCKSSTLANKTYYVRFQSFDNSNISFELKLYRDPVLNRQLTNQANYNVFVIAKNGANLKQVNCFDLNNNQPQATNTKVAYFQGKLLISQAGLDRDSYTEINNTTVLAMGYLDDQSGFISLQGFIRLKNGTFLYLHPETNVEDRIITTTSNLHYLSTENDQLVKSYEHIHKQFTQKRRKRNPSVLVEENVEKDDKSCPIMIMADYSLYQLMKESRAKTVLFIHFVFTLGNNIFVSTTFTQSGFSPEEDEKLKEGYEQFVGYGHSLLRIVIEEHKAEPNHWLYNSNRDYWVQREIETKLKTLWGREHFCLSFLFTNLPIVENEIDDKYGLAMVGGIFSQTKNLSNVGVVSFFRCKDPWNLLCVLVFPHELGHHWGAPHDVKSAECMPEKNGSYLVSYPFLGQIGPNNFKFSPCSIRSIYEKIQKLEGPSKFISYYIKCGNGIIDEGEECDEGKKEAIGVSCCTTNCKLEAGANCSPYNHHCCDDQCRIVSQSSQTVCLQADPQYCYAEVVCNGTLNGCPVKELRPKLADGQPCFNGGTCLKGYCNSACPVGSIDCECLPDSCHVCCAELFYDETKDTVVQGECNPLIDVFKPEASHCLINNTERGFCSAIGWCVQMKVNVDDDKEDVVSSLSSLGNETSFEEENTSVVVEVIGVLVIIVIFVLFFIFRAVNPLFQSNRFETFLNLNESGNVVIFNQNNNVRDEKQPKEKEVSIPESHVDESDLKDIPKENNV